MKTLQDFINVIESCDAHKVAAKGRDRTAFRHHHRLVLEAKTLLPLIKMLPHTLTSDNDGDFDGFDFSGAAEALGWGEETQSALKYIADYSMVFFDHGVD